MAIRFRGPHSPGARPAPPPTLPVRAEPGHLRHRLESRTAWITAAASPLLVTAFFQDPAGLAANLAGFGAIAAGMVMTRQGLQAEAAYEARPVARRPAIPRKLFGGVLTGLGLALGAFEPGALAGAGIVGLTGGLLHWLSFGSDPMRDKGMSGDAGFQQERVALVLADAEAHLAAMQRAIAATGRPQLAVAMEDFTATARALFRQLQDNPAELPAARRYLGVWLLGAREATERLAAIEARTPGGDADARTAWAGLMADLATEFAARSRRMIEGGRADMDIEIGVLRDRLAREGVAGQPPAPARPQLQDTRSVTLDELLRTPDKTPEPR